MADWIDNISSAWKGHRQFAEWLVETLKPQVVVELGVDYGFSTFCFATALEKHNAGTIYGVDLFEGDIHTGFRDTSNIVNDQIKEHNVSHVEIIKGDFTEVSRLWTKAIDVLHIDGLHTYEAVKNDFMNWSKFVKNDGIILFHDVAVPDFGIKDFFREISGCYKLYFLHSAGLGIVLKDPKLYMKILENFPNVHDNTLEPL